MSKQSPNLYGFPTPINTVFPAPIIAQRAPTTADISYPIGQGWIDEVGDDAYVLVDVTAGVATWNVTATTPGNVDTLTGGSGGAITPSAGNINVLGTANQITTTGAGSTITWSLPSAITAPGSLATTSTLSSGTTLTAGSSLAVTTTAVIGTGLTVSAGGAAITGTSSINSSGSSVTTIGTGGTGAVNIGNATGNTAVTGSLTSSTTLTATLGAITATNGDVVLGTAGNKLKSTSVASTTTAGANSFGKVSLSSGAATVSTTAALTGSIIILTTQALGTVTTPMPIAVTARSNGVSFTITSSDATDTSSIGWMIIN